MGINLNGNISGIYLGSSKITDAYLGNVKVFGSSYSIPANALRIRFSNASYTPNTSSGTWTKISGVNTNDWEWKNSGADWAHGFGTNSQKQALPAFTVVDAGDLSSVTSFGEFFCYCLNLTQDAGEILNILSSKISGTPSLSYMFAFAGITNCSQWPSVFQNNDCTRMFATCYDLSNPNYPYSQASSRGCTTTNMVALAGMNSSAGRTSLISAASAAGGSASQGLSKGYWNWLNSNNLSWVDNPNGYRLAARIPVFSNFLSSKNYTYRAKIANTTSTSLNRVLRSYFAGCFDYKGTTPSDTSKSLNGLDAFFQVGSSGITWYYAAWHSRLVDSSWTYGDKVRYNYDWQPYRSYGTFDKTKETFFSLVGVYAQDQADTWAIPPKKFFLPRVTSANSASAILGAFGNAFTISA
jgi:hypothetical protein